MGLFTPIQNLLGLANTWAANQVLNGTNNIAPNQTAAGNSSLMTKGLVENRLILTSLYNASLSLPANPTTVPVFTLTVPAGAMRSGSVAILSLWSWTTTATVKTFQSIAINNNSSNYVCNLTKSYIQNNGIAFKRVLFAPDATSLSSASSTNGNTAEHGESFGVGFSVTQFPSTLNTGISLSSGFTIDFLFSAGTAGDTIGVLAYLELIKY